MGLYTEKDKDISIEVCFDPYTSVELRPVLFKYPKIPGCYYHKFSPGRGSLSWDKPHIKEFLDLGEELDFLLKHTDDTLFTDTWPDPDDAGLYFEMNVYIAVDEVFKLLKIIHKEKPDQLDGWIERNKLVDYFRLANRAADRPGAAEEDELPPF